jgi:2-polyprenyl-3-methyl-5-hydroxy-6-metoxy-1,4-benzoquinol methylase/uncharacterized protein YbaR (Trm112 family)
MKPVLLEMLKCPKCAGLELELLAFRQDVEEIVDGLITCHSCGMAYPVIHYIPRFVPVVPADFPEFYVRYGPKICVKHPDYGNRDWAATKKAYTNWWLKVHQRHGMTARDEKIFLRQTGLAKDFFRGLICLDAGCGDGRFSKFLCEAGAEVVVGMDLGQSVEVAREYNNSAQQQYVQGDILNPPFREEMFDFACAIGVLHHTPSPKEGMKRIADSLREQGTLSVYLYAKEIPRYNGLRSFLHREIGRSLFNITVKRVFSRLPHGVILLWAKALWKKRLLAEALKKSDFAVSRWGGKALAVFPPDVYSPYVSAEENIERNYDAHCTPYQSTHSVEELIEWFIDMSFDDLIVTPYRTTVTGRKVAELSEPVKITYSRSRGRRSLSKDVKEDLESEDGYRGDNGCAV